MTFQNCGQEDIDDIFRLYRIASAFQKGKGVTSWPEFDRYLVETEIAEKRQWKLLINGEIACVWAIAFSDPLIWGEQNADPAIYIHRIATNPDFRGQNMVMKITGWARNYAAEKNKKYIRLDTVQKNERLISLYTGCGFDFLGLSTLKDTTGLPPHYEKALVSLFQISL